jgi:5-methyltetrahydropteroyltriglutamate--homocysteine methyltransferase
MQRANPSPGAVQQETPPFRADHVGSLLRPQELKDAARDFHARKIGEDQFRAVQDRCIREAVRMQEDVGLQSITDGEFRRGSWFLGFIEALEGLTTAPSLYGFYDDVGGHASFQTAYVQGKLRRRRGITTGEFEFVRSITKATPKVTMPTPSLVHFFRGDEAVDRTVYPNLDEFWSDLVAIYREELDDLAAVGCRYVQLDEVPCAMLCDPKIREEVCKQGVDPERLVDSYIDAINAAVAAKPAGMTVALHLCRGNYKGRWMAEGGYEVIAKKLFRKAAVDAFFLEYDSDRAGGFEPLRLVPDDKRVVLGLISSKSPMLEPLDGLRRRVEEANRFLPLDRLCVSPQCGFASSVGGNPLTIEDERRKLRRVVELAHSIWS